MRKNIILLSTLMLVLAMVIIWIGLVKPAAAAGIVYPAAENALQLTPGAELTKTVWLPIVANGSSSEDVDDDGVTDITLNGDSILVEGDGAVANSSVVTITSAGVYSISGTLTNGQIVVSTEETGTVELILNGVNITNATGAPLFINSAEETLITLADGAENHLTDGATYIFAEGEDEPDAALFSKDDLVIGGNGSLVVNANYKNGITGKDDLEITGGNITVNAVNHGIKGKDSITVRGGTFTITAGGDGMQSDNDEDADKGYILIEDGEFNITSANDGIQAETTLTVNAGTFTIVAGGGSATVTDDSAKGLKAGANLIITGGDIDINAADDALHSNGSLTIDNGEMALATADDGIHAELTLTINDGEITISKCYEGIESTVIVINDGTIHLNADDDGINVAGGNDNPITPADYHLDINGGYIVVDADGDGLDANGSINMSAGVVLVNGPTNNGNGAIDYDGAFTMTGGFLAAVGSAGMAQAPSATSTQYAVLVNLTAAKSGGTLFHLQTQAGEDILTFALAKTYQSVAISSPELAKGTSYTVYTGGSSTGTVTDGLYTGGTYTPGTQAATFTISNIITVVGSGGGGGFPGGRINRSTPPDETPLAQ